MKGKDFASLALALCAVPAFATNWSYDGSASQKYLLDDTGWKFKIALNKTVAGATGTQLDACVAAGTAVALDFSSGLPQEVGSIIAFGSVFYKTPGQSVIQSVVLPDGIVSIGEGAFRECSNLVTVEPLLPDTVRTVGGNAFYLVSTVRGHLVLGQTGPVSLSTSGAGTFKNCSALQEITLGDGVTSVPATCFYGCSSVTNVTLGANLASIGNESFRGMTSLRRVTPLLPDSVTSIGNSAFYDDALLSGHLVIGRNGGTALSSSGSTFQNCKELQEITIGDGVTSIPSSAFKGCTSVTNMTLGENITSLGTECFRGMTALERVTPFLPASVSSIANKVFTDNRNLGGTLVLRGGAEGEGDITWTGSGDTFIFSLLAITNIVIGPGVTTLPQACFAGNPGVKEVNFYGYTTWKSTTFHYNKNYPWNQYQSRFLVPNGDADWITYYTDSTKVTPWDGSKLADYQAKFGVDAEIPVGITVGDNKQYVVVKPNGAAAAAKQLVVSGETGGAPFEIGEVVPAYGTHLDVSGDLPLACSAPEYVDYGDTRYRCAGHVLSLYDNNMWTDPVTNASRTLTYNPGDNTMRRLVWLWEPAGYKITILYPSEFGSVTASAPWADGFYAAGSTASFTATPAGTVFGGWTGASAPYPMVTSPQISVVADAEKTLIPYFVTNWVLAADNKSMADGYWRITTTRSGDALKLTVCGADYPDIGILDLRKPVDRGVITAIGQNFALNRAAARNIRDLLLPDTLGKLESSAFNGLANLVTVTPFLPESVTNIQDRAFKYCPILESDLTLGMNRRRSVTFGGEAHFVGDNAIRKVTMGPGVASVPKYCLFTMSGLEEAELLADTVALGEWAFHDTQVKTVKFGGFPTFGVAPFHNHADYTACLYVPRGDARWQAFMADPDEMTPWADLGETLQNQYWSRYPDGKTPKGMTLKTTGAGGFGRMWVFLWSPRPTATILSVR